MMKMMYQQMIAFFAVIGVALAIVGVLFTQFTTKMVEDDTYHQLNRFALTVAKDSMRFKQDDGSFVNFDDANFATQADILAAQDINFAVFTADGTKVYPKQSDKTITLSKGTLAKAAAGKTLQIKGETKQRVDSLEVVRPFKDGQGKFSGVIVTRAKSETVAENLSMLTKNLLIAFGVSLVVAVVLGYLLSQVMVNRLRLIQLVTRRVASGEYNTEIKVHGRDEISALGRDVNVMTQALAEQQDEIAAQEERRKEFMANASHEMRTPLTTISGIVEALQYDVIPEEDKQHSYDLVKAEADRLYRLVKENLDYERLRQNKVVLKRTRFNAVTVIENLIEQLGGKADLAHDVFDFQHTGEVIVDADRDRFIQIIFNILNNAIQFTENGKITVAAERLNGGSRFTISDTGIGMTPDQVAKIWERYYKADESRTKRGEAGLGMAIIRQLVEVHNGEIHVVSTYGEGTTFTVTLPDAEKNDD